ncbi:MAG: ribosomal protein S18-alanine N-acetyltransferase [Desulfovibrio sp.]|jgi:ribosomal-protein-alanine N-acetyltransferase|nr:ribosomal protein S18-alanine N-acetyltransferase [Desulfovibrio sp.]
MPPYDKSAVCFQRLDKSHAGAVHELEKSCFSLPWSEEQCRRAFDQPFFAAFGLMRGARLVAYVSVYHTASELEILNLAVSPPERRQGLGRRALDMALQVARKMGIKRAVLEVRAGNSPAISLYRSCGFVKTAVRPHYYSDTGEDAVIYVCQLRSPSATGADCAKNHSR